MMHFPAQRFHRHRPPQDLHRPHPYYGRHGKLTVNGRSFETYFVPESFAKQAAMPLITVALNEKFDVTANVAGGGLAGQAGAVAHGIARALQKFNAELRPALKKAGHISAILAPRSVRKPVSRARKRFQFSKR